MKGAGLLKAKKHALSAVSSSSTAAPVRPTSSQETSFLSYWEARPAQAVPEEGVLFALAGARSA